LEVIVSLVNIYNHVIVRRNRFLFK